MTLISEQIDLAAWEHEARNLRGEWISGPDQAAHGYDHPDHDRLINPRGRPPDIADHPWFREHPVSPHNILAAWDAATPGQRDQGMTWYEDAHDLAAAIGKQYLNGDTDRAAGLLAAFSPQTAWPINMFNAVKTAKAGTTEGFRGQATGAFLRNAQEALDGVPLDQSMPSPKINSFGHLIAAGGDTPGDRLGEVVIDRHAVDVAAGDQINDAVLDKAPIGDERGHEYVADQYRLAAKMLSQREGREISPHQVQAVTWLVRQAEAEAAERAAVRAGTLDPNQQRLYKGRITRGRNAWREWTQYAQEHDLPVKLGTTSKPGSAIAPEAQRSPEGFSVSLAGQEPASGYMVAVNDHTHTFPADIMSDEGRLADAIDQMLLSERDVFSQDGMYLGGWVHDGKLWLEPSENIQDRGEAVSTARQHNQIAIWDVVNGQEIQTGGTGGGSITEHARSHAEGDYRAGPGGLRGPPGGGAQEDRAAAGQAGPPGIAAQFFELASDAWRHEPRDSHGRWVHSIGEQAADVPAESFDWDRGGLSEQIRNTNGAVRREWSRVPTDSPMAFYLNRAGAHLSTALLAADDNERENELAGAAEELGHAADAAAENGDKAAARRYRLMARNMGRLQEEAVKRQATAAALTAFTRNAALRVPGLLGGGKEAWNGRVQLFSQDEKYAAAELNWQGQMNFEESLAISLEGSQGHKGMISDPMPYAVVLHEMIHGVVPEGSEFRDGQEDYQDKRNANIEEGFTELGTIQHAADFFDAVGAGRRETRVLATGPDGAPVDNPAYFRAVSSLIKDLQAQYVRLSSDLRGPQQQAVDRLGREIERLKDDPELLQTDWEAGLDDAMREIQHLGDPELAAWAEKTMSGPVRKARSMQMTKHATMAEYAERLNDPERIKNGEAWGHYQDQTAKALSWVQDVAHEEGLADLTTPEGRRRIQELSDEINQQGVDGKVHAMADQLVRAVKLPPVPLPSGVTEALPDALSGSHSGHRHPAGIMTSSNWYMLEDSIRDSFASAASSARSPMLQAKQAIKIMQQGMAGVNA